LELTTTSYQIRITEDCYKTPLLIIVQTSPLIIVQTPLMIIVQIPPLIIVQTPLQIIVQILLLIIILIQLMIRINRMILPHHHSHIMNIKSELIK
jgi:hypothetical protein